MKRPSRTHREEPRKIWEKAVKTQKPVWLVLALLVNMVLILYTEIGTLQKFPNSGDEYAYLISAQLFTEGKLSVPSPEPREFFDIASIVNNGSYYGKYPPGWPALLALGMKLDAVWWVNPILGLLTLAVLYFLIRGLFSPEAANVAMVFTLVNPYFIFNSASLFSHGSCLLFIAIAAYCLLKPNPKGWGTWLGLGASAGMAFLIRPYTAVLLLAPSLLYAAWNTWKKKDYPIWKGWLLGTLPAFAVFVGLFLLYNQTQTGHAFRQPFEVYDPGDRLGFQTVWCPNPLDRLNQNILTRWVYLAKWSAWAPFWMLAFLVFRKAKDPFYSKGLVLCLSFFVLLAGYYFYWGEGANQYGPRYLL
jgi:4-amino-4-deoxy-L-arabinose transferase-like glycosyltransferase